MQNAVPIGEGGMLAILGVEIDSINKLLLENKDKFECYIANDNSVGQIVVSGTTNSLDKLEKELKKQNMKHVKLQVSAPFHCPLMKKASQEMKQKLIDTEFKNPTIDIISNACYTVNVEETGICRHGSASSRANGTP